VKKVAVFGKPGGGKSTFSKALSKATGIELYPLDLIEYHKNGDKVDKEEFLASYNEILAKDNWIIDGFVSLQLLEQQLEVADTIIYIDLPYYRHYWWVTKRFLKSPFLKPEGWPDGSSALKGTIVGYKVLKLSPKFWNNELLAKLRKQNSHKNFFHLTSVAELNGFIKTHDGAR